MRYTVIRNTDPGKVLCSTDSINEACYCVWHVSDRYVWGKTPAYDLLVHHVGESEQAEPSLYELACERLYGIAAPVNRSRNAFAILDHGEAMWLCNAEVQERASRWNHHLSERYERERQKEAQMNRRSSGRAHAGHWRRNRYHSALVADNPADEDIPRLRPGARVFDWWWEDVYIHDSKSWKDQTKRRHQWKPVTM